MALIQFTRNHHDLSTDAGFQFDFFCDRCGNGYQTEFQGYSLGTVSNVLDAANNLFGGVLGNAANAARNVRSAAWEKSHDNVFRKPWRKPSHTSINANVPDIGWTTIVGILNAIFARNALWICERKCCPSRCKPPFVMLRKKLIQWIMFLPIRSNRQSQHPVHIVEQK